MRLRLVITVVAALCLLAGCGGTQGPPPLNTPITRAEWEAMPFEQKYDPDTFERLRKGEPKLKDERAWKAFFSSVIVPKRKADLQAETQKK